MHHFQFHFTRPVIFSSPKTFTTATVFKCHIIWILFPVWKLLNYTNCQRKHSELFSNRLSVGVNCTSTWTEEQSSGSLMQYWLSRFRLTFICHLFLPRPKHLTEGNSRELTLEKASSQLPPHHQFHHRIPHLNGTHPSYYLSTASEILQETEILPTKICPISHLHSSLNHTPTFGN